MSEPFKKVQITSFDYTEPTEEQDPQVEEQLLRMEEMPNQFTMDQHELLEAYKSLIAYKNNLLKVDVLLMNEEDEATIQEIRGIKEELEPAIEQQEERIKQMQNSNEFYFSVDRVKQEDVDKTCKAYYEQDKKWYNAKILSVDADNLEAEVQFIGYQEIVKLHFIFIKVNIAADPACFTVGGQCEAIYSVDGRYYPCNIEKITEEGYLVKFKKYNNRETVSIYYLRESKKIDLGNKKKMFEDLDDFKQPDNLRYLPTDNEQQRKAKKKKLKALKQAFKQAQMDKYSNDQKSKWQDFNKKLETVKPDIGQVAESVFRTPDNPEGKVCLGDIKAAAYWDPKRKYKNDNSHLQKLF